MTKGFGPNLYLTSVWWTDVLWNFNKKVLLCERKRHTDRGVSSTPYGALSGGGGVPTLAGGGYLPWQGVTYPGWGTCPGQGVPTLAGGTYPGQGIYPPPRIWTDWKHNLPSRTTYAVGKEKWGTLVLTVGLFMSQCVLQVTSACRFKAREDACAYMCQCLNSCPTVNRKQQVFTYFLTQAIDNPRS